MIREQQRAAYSTEVYPVFELLEDQDLVVGGPLKGLLSFHHYYPDKDVLVLPCDMPHITESTLRDLIGFYQNHSDHDAWVFEEGNLIQPFPGIYAASYLFKVDKQLRLEATPRLCLMDVMKGGRTATYRPKTITTKVFLNANYPEDVQ
jgi:molybdopterin-guanine dinucleotide biosynthesis protein A